MSLRPRVRAELEAHGIPFESGDQPPALRELLNEAYLVEVRELRARRAAGEIAARDYAPAVLALRERYPLLGLPLKLWEE